MIFSIGLQLTNFNSDRPMVDITLCHTKITFA